MQTKIVFLQSCSVLMYALLYTLSAIKSQMNIVPFQAARAVLKMVNFGLKVYFFGSKQATAHENHCVCKSISQVFIVLGMYNFVCTLRSMYAARSPHLSLSEMFRKNCLSLIASTVIFPEEHMLCQGISYDDTSHGKVETF